MTIAYLIMAITSIILAVGYFFVVPKKDKWFIMLYISVCLVNICYLLISVSSNIDFALFANKIAYFGQIFVITSMFMIITKLCGISYNKKISIVLLVVGLCMFLIICTTGYLPWYYKDAYIINVDGYNVLYKEYGPLQFIYMIYILAYFAAMIVICIYSINKKQVSSQKEAILMLIVVFGNIAMWIVEKCIKWEFELLAISYLMSELILLGINWMMQDFVHVDTIEKRKINGYSQANYVLMSLTIEEKLERIFNVLPKGEILAPREKEILEALLENKRRKDIAEELHLSENTIKTYIRSLYSKLNVSSREELFRLLIDE